MVEDPVQTLWMGQPYHRRKTPPTLPGIVKAEAELGPAAQWRVRVVCPGGWDGLKVAEGQVLEVLLGSWSATVHKGAHRAHLWKLVTDVGDAQRVLVPVDNGACLWVWPALVFHVFNLEGPHFELDRGVSS